MLLGIEGDLMTKWEVIAIPADIPLMARTLAVSETTARVMVNRNVRTKNTALRFLNPTLASLADPLLMKDMDSAARLAGEAAATGAKITVYGDYDVDGVMSSVILYKTLRAAGADVSCVIPNRESEGYGLNMEAVRRLAAEGTEMLIACDNGVASVEEIAEAKRLGMKVVVIDHHEPGFTRGEDGEKRETIPVADAMVDPKQASCPYPFKMLCAAGISYQFARAFHQRIGLPFTREKEFLALAMAATFCDIVDLQGENRVIAKLGLDALNEDSGLNLGLHTLIRAKSLEGKAIGGYAIGFILGPCVNATGRLGSAALAVELFTTEDAERAEELAGTLVELNEIRKSMTALSYEQAVELIENSEVKDQAVMVLFHRDTHESIAGIVAGRLKERYHKPALMLTPSADFPESHLVKGSARSIEAYNIFDGMSACKDLFERFGGHAMAAGVTLRAENVPALRRRLNESCGLTAEDFVEVVKIDKELDMSEATYELAEELARLAPFGKANKEPLFLTKGLTPCGLRVAEAKNTLIFTFGVPGTYRKIKGVCFGRVESFRNGLAALYGGEAVEKIMGGALREANFSMNVVYALDINAYNGNMSVQMKIKDFTIDDEKRGS